MSNDAALDALADFAERLRAIPDSIEDALDKIAHEIETYLHGCIARGVDPDGKPWPETEAGGIAAIGRTLRVRVTDVQTITIEVSGSDVLHHEGTARGRVTRRLIPVASLPPELAARIEAIIAEAIVKAVQS